MKKSRLNNLIVEAYAEVLSELKEAPEGLYYIKVKRTDKASINGLQDVVETWYSPVRFADIVDDDGAGNVIFYIKKDDWDAGMMDDIRGNGVQVVDTNVPSTFTESIDGGQLFDYFNSKGYEIVERSADGRKEGFEGYQVKRGNDRYPQSVIFQHNKDTDEFTISRMSGYRIDQEEAKKAGMREAGRSGAAGMDSYMTDGNYTPVEISAEGLKDIVDHVMTGLDRESKAQSDFYKHRGPTSGTVDEEIIKESLYDLMHEDEDETDDYGRPYVDPKGSRTYVDPKDMTPAARAAKMLKEEEPEPEEEPDNSAGPETVLEDATDTILAKFPTVKAAIIKLQTEDFKEFVESIDWISPRPTSFRVNLKNGTDYILKWTGKTFQAEIMGKRYLLSNISDYQQAIDKLSLLYREAPMSGAGEGEPADTDTGGGGGGGGDFPGDDAAGGDDFGGDDAGADVGGDEGGEDLSDEPIDFEAGEEG